MLPLPPDVGWTDKGMVEKRDSGDAPGVAGQGTRAEAADVVGKIGDDDFDKLEGKPGSGGRVCRRDLQGRTS